MRKTYKVGIIKKKLCVFGSIRKRECEVLFDIDASACFVREDIAKQISQILQLPNSLIFTLWYKNAIKTELITALQIDIKSIRLLICS